MGRVWFHCRAGDSGEPQKPAEGLNCRAERKGRGPKGSAQTSLQTSSSALQAPSGPPHRDLQFPHTIPAPCSTFVTMGTTSHSSGKRSRPEAPSSGTNGTGTAPGWDSGRFETRISGISCHRVVRERRSGTGCGDAVGGVTPSPRVPLAQDGDAQRGLGPAVPAAGGGRFAAGGAQTLPAEPFFVP